MQADRFATTTSGEELQGRETVLRSLRSIQPGVVRFMLQGEQIMCSFGEKIGG